MPDDAKSSADHLSKLRSIIADAEAERERREAAESEAAAARAQKTQLSRARSPVPSCDVASDFR